MHDLRHRVGGFTLFIGVDDANRIHGTVLASLFCLAAGFRHRPKGTSATNGGSYTSSEDGAVPDRDGFTEGARLFGRGQVTSSGLAPLKSLDLLGHMVSQRFNAPDSRRTIFGG
jgi:hypothetical protein